jgi:hypothetical protein
VFSDYCVGEVAAFDPQHRDTARAAGLLRDTQQEGFAASSRPNYQYDGGSEFDMPHQLFECRAHGPHGRDAIARERITIELELTEKRHGDLLEPPP